MPEIPPEEKGQDASAIVDLPPPGKYGCLGREEQMSLLEGAFAKAPVVILSGVMGVGKTELACGLARGLAEKGEREGGVVYTYFGFGAGLCRVLHEVGTTLQGIGFARLSLKEQRSRVLDHMKNKSCLLIWDNFDSIFGYLDDVETREILDFLSNIGTTSQDASQGVGRLLITCRESEWARPLVRASDKYAHLELTGLAADGRRELAALILGGAGIATQMPGPDYDSLLDLLDGNPMAMRRVLPHLNQRTPLELSQDFQRFQQDEDIGQNVSGPALACSYSLLAPRTRAHLPFLSLFRQCVLLDVLTHMTQGEEYASILGEKMGWGACRTFLREARDAAILESISPSVYLISPSVSVFLRGKLERSLTTREAQAPEQEFLRVYADLGDYFLESLASESADSTVTGVLAEEANLLGTLQTATEAGQWERVQLILQPLGQVYKMQERILELQRLRGRLMDRVGAEPEEAERAGAIDLWLFLQGSQLNDALGRDELEQAEGVCHSMLSYLERDGGDSHQPRIASIYHSLGLVAQGRDQLEEAGESYTKSLAINESLESESECADTYHQLGLMAYSQGRHDEAEGWHRRALEIRERMEDEADAALECHRLALIAEARLLIDDAVNWYHRARVGFERVDDKAATAAVYHRLGLIAQAKYDYEEAAGWYQRALLLHEQLGDDVGDGSDYYQLGVIALQRYDYQDAEDHLGAALGAYQRWGKDLAIANTSHQLGIAAHAQRRYAQAYGLYEDALKIFVRFEDEVAAAMTWGQQGLLADHLGNYADAVWYVAHTYEIAVARELPLVGPAKEHLSALRTKMGGEAFLKSWREVSDTDILAELA